MGLTRYKIDVHPSMVIHWKTVNMAKPKLSKLMNPYHGPSQPISLHSSPSGQCRPFSPHGFVSSVRGRISIDNKDDLDSITLFLNDPTRSVYVTSTMHFPAE